MFIRLATTDLSSKLCYFLVQEVLEKLAAKFLERSEAKIAEEAAEISAIEVKKRSERLQKIEDAQRRIHRGRDERYQEITRALLLSEVNHQQCDQKVALFPQKSCPKSSHKLFT